MSGDLPRPPRPPSVRLAWALHAAWLAVPWPEWLRHWWYAPFVTVPVTRDDYWGPHWITNEGTKRQVGCPFPRRALTGSVWRCPRCGRRWVCHTATASGTRVFGWHTLWRYRLATPHVCGPLAGVDPRRFGLPPDYPIGDVPDLTPYVQRQLREQVRRLDWTL